jgi:hypothetical protein
MISAVVRLGLTTAVLYILWARGVDHVVVAVISTMYIANELVAWMLVNLRKRVAALEANLRTMNEVSRMMKEPTRNDYPLA